MIMSKNKALLRKKRLPAFICAMSVWLPAQAQQVETGAIVLEEIIVTAQKRDQSIQDIGFSVSAFDEDDAARFGNDIGALAGQTPGVEAYGSNSYLQTFFVRGIGLNEFAGNFNAPIATHKDEVYVSKNWATARATFDLERIEVLKGPQGTLFGRNATGGAVNYYSKAPTQETDGYINATFDEFSRAAVEGAIGGALSEDVAGRVSFYRGFGDGGPQDNLFTGDEHGEPDVTEIRGQLLWEINDKTSIKFSAYGGTDNSETLGYKGPGIFEDTRDGFAPGTICSEIISGAAQTQQASCTRFGGVTGDDNLEFESNDPFTINQNNAPERDDDFFGGSIRFEHDFGNIQLTSLTSYDTYERNNREDSDSTPIASADAFFFNDLDIFTQELRLNGVAANDKLNYVAGFFYLSEDLEQADRVDFTANPGPLPPGIFGVFEQNVESYAAFFNADYALNDKWTVAVGARYTEDETDIDAITGVNIGAVGNNEPEIILALVDDFEDSRTDTNFSYRLGLSYNLNESTLLYANLATAFRTGGFSVPLAGPVAEFEDETLDSLELGIKTDLSSTLRINAAAFFYQYQDFQVSVGDSDSPIVPTTQNIDESEVFGFEADLTWLPSENTEVHFGYSYLDSELTETDNTLLTFSASGQPTSLAGNSPVNAPENQFNASFQYADRVTSTMNWSAYVDYRWVDDRFLEISNEVADEVDSYGVVNASVGLQSADDKWNISLWVKNLTDEEYITYINNLPGAGFALNIFGEQRATGITLGYKF